MYKKYLQKQREGRNKCCCLLNTAMSFVIRPATFAIVAICLSLHLYFTSFAFDAICISHHLLFTPFAFHAICISSHIHVHLTPMTNIKRSRSRIALLTYWYNSCTVYTRLYYHQILASQKRVLVVYHGNGVKSRQ